MTGPKHLWSGEWEDESAAASQRHAGRRPPAPDDEPDPPHDPPARARARTSPQIPPALRRALPVIIAAVVVIAAGAWGLTALLGSSGSASATTAAGLTPASTRPVSWLGMEIQTLPPGVAVIETVQLGSQGDRAGLESGEVILRIDNRPINGAGDIAAAIHGLQSGDRVVLQISQGSALYETEATLAAPPSAYP